MRSETSCTVIKTMVNNNPPPSGASDAAEDVLGEDNDSASEKVTEEVQGEFVAKDEAQESVAAEPAAQDDADPVATVADLRAQLDKALADSEAQREQALRAVAESDNVRKRAQRDLENAHKFALERFVNELLPVKDSLELGLAAAEDSSSLEGLIEGTQMTLRMLGSAMEKFGVHEVAPAGEPFDPQVHQAMTTREADGQPSGTVLEVVQKGYVLNERLVRPAMVVVSK